MDEAYLIARMKASLAMARATTESVARLIHYELAGRYSLAAVNYPPSAGAIPQRISN